MSGCPGVASLVTYTVEPSGENAGVLRPMLSPPAGFSDHSTEPVRRSIAITPFGQW
jgi:hypothetical protein